jgi:hypothetical protein
MNEKKRKAKETFIYSWKRIEIENEIIITIHSKKSLNL